MPTALNPSPRGRSACCEHELRAADEHSPLASQLEEDAFYQRHLRAGPAYRRQPPTHDSEAVITLATGETIAEQDQLQAGPYSDNMYRPSAQFRRTADERKDQLLSWKRDDQRFFAAGACHILAFAFLETYPEAGFRPVGLWPRGAKDPSHLYVSDGTWAFDHDGWTLELDLLAATRAFEPEADFQSHVIQDGIDKFCADHHHRPRQLFAFDPWSRALHYLAGFSPPSCIAL
ncbi:hypothetical protein [Streptomyces sp. NPDC048508]|uniref:hypothetical protein n=1 Tax=Streptomyces sp. NPDC048508 TaxID=3365561 RepID=UPI003724BA53